MKGDMFYLIVYKTQQLFSWFWKNIVKLLAFIGISMIIIAFVSAETLGPGAHFVFDLGIAFGLLAIIIKIFKK
jgi:hypothetical protein